MTYEQYLLDILKEECAEVIHRACKSTRFSLEDVQIGQDYSNEERLNIEINDLYGILDLLHANHIMNTNRNEKLITAKINKINKYIDYSMSLGVL